MAADYKLNGIDISANVYTPPNYDPGTRYPAVVVAHPNGGVKEQVAGLYARILAEQGYVAIAADAADQGAGGGMPRNVDKPSNRIEDIHGMTDSLYMTKPAFEGATNAKGKELFPIDGATHIETYWKPQHVNRAMGKSIRFFDKAAPLVIREQGSFAVGGTVVTNPGTFDPIRMSPEGQTFHGDHAYVSYQIPVNARKLPLVLWPGFGQFSKTWDTTPDGREGFRNISGAVEVDPRAIRIARSGEQPSDKGPEECFTGSVRVTMLVTPTAPSRTSVGRVAFEPGARTAWHAHPFGQTLIVTEGVGRIQRWDGKVEEIRPGDVVSIPPGTKHRHGASPDSAMTHLAIQEHRDGKSAEWMEKVRD